MNHPEPSRPDASQAPAAWSRVRLIFRSAMRAIGYLVLVIVAVGFIRPVSVFRLPHGDSVRVDCASVWGAFSSAFLGTPESCRFTYNPQSGPPVEFKLVQDLFDQPWMVIPAKERGVFFCFYDFDVSYPLFRIDTKAKFSSPAPSADQRLTEIVSSSQCAVSIASTEEFNETISCLRSSAPAEIEHYSLPRFGFYRPHFDKDDVSQIITAMKADWGR